MSNAGLFALDQCIKCSICTANCPVARVTDSFSGPKQSGPDLERFRLQGLAAVHPSIDLCSNCKNCDVVCPSGVGISAMNCRARGELKSAEGVPLRDRLLAGVQLMGRFSRVAPSLVNWAGNSKIIRYAGEKLLGISAGMTLPLYSPKTFHQLYNANRPAVSDKKVVYFPGCYVNYNSPEVGMALVRVMERSGIEVLKEEFSCCGLPLISGGMPDEAGRCAEKNIQVLQAYAGKGYPLVTSCPSCSLSLRQEYRELFDLDITESTGIMIYDIFEYLQELQQEGSLDLNFKGLDLRAGYHQPCHLRAAGCGSPSLGLLALIPGCQIADLDAGCCGLAGSYGFKKEKYNISRAIGQDLVQAVKKSGLSKMVTECGMCRLQIYHGTGIDSYHPIQLLDRAYSSQ
ncbi:MAG: anaerobic glycerol-3-phosphate dehydrogenase subunit C [Desulfocucumaceae bacterium]